MPRLLHHVPCAAATSVSSRTALSATAPRPSRWPRCTAGEGSPLLTGEDYMSKVPPLVAATAVLLRLANCKIAAALAAIPIRSLFVWSRNAGLLSMAVGKVSPLPVVHFKTIVAAWLRRMLSGTSRTARPGARRSLCNWGSSSKR